MYLHINAVTAWSLLQYVKRVRLLHARSLLIAGQGKATSIVFGVGYGSPNQFSREYARLFDPPLARSRESYATESGMAGAPFPC